MGSGGCISRDAKNRVTVHALRHVSLRFQEGDRIGLLGPNGASKLTLLRVIAGIYEPARGALRDEGQVSSIFNLRLDSGSTRRPRATRISSSAAWRRG